MGWRGYKAHFTETCEPDRPHLIVHVATTVATTADVETMPARHADLASLKLLPDEHLVDASYVSVDGVLAAHADHGVELVGPLPPDSGWQARDEEGLDLWVPKISSAPLTCGFAESEFTYPTRSTCVAPAHGASAAASTA